MHMRKSTTILSAAAVALALAGSAYADKVITKGLNLKETTEKKEVKRYLGDGTFKAEPLKTPEKASSKAETILISEDFSNMTAGTVDQPDTTQMLACEYSGYSPNGVYIDNSLTSGDGTWWGSQVYSAGGAVAIKTYNPQQMAYICTPLGDYSGDITVTCKIKALPALIKTDDGYAKLSGSGMYIMACTGGYESMDYADTDDENQQYYEQKYEKEGWQKITYTFKNFSADNGGYICFATEGAMAIDDIEITTSASFIASPAMNGITDFQKDNFTISWQPVRKAFNYYIDLFTKEYTSDNDTTFTANFDDGTMPEGFTSTSSEFSDNEGVDNSKALVLKDGDCLTFPTNDNEYKNLHFYLRTIDETVDKTDEYAQWYVNGELTLEYKKDGKWKELGTFYGSGFWKKGDTIKLEDEYSKFSTLQATQWRIKASELNDGAYFVVDNVDITAAPSFAWKLVNGENSLNWEGDYVYYDTTKKTEYTFTDLDPNTEYYYGVRSHYVHIFSDRKYIHALGVAAPDVLDATDIDSRGSFTANWEKAPKATGYTVTCYGAATADKDYEDYPVLDEDFSKIDASVTSATTADEATPLGNSSTTCLNDYTQTPGWTGDNNTAAIGMLGAEGDYYSGGEIKTPELDLRHADNFKLELAGKATSSDYLVVRVDGTSYYLTVPSDGVIDGTYYLPKGGKRMAIRFYSYSAAPFVFDKVKVTQKVTKDDQILTWLDSAKTDGETTSYTFTGLYDFNYSDYAYNVVSNFDYSAVEQTSSLTPSATVFVNLGDGTSTTGISELANGEDLKVVARYTADGQLVAAPVKGLNIVKYSNGKTVKVVVK